MKATKNSKKSLRITSQENFLLDEFEKAMNHPELSTRQKLEITDAYFAKPGSIDITDQLIGQSSIYVRGPRR